MNIVEAFRREPDRVLDRLVDNELSRLERQQLLASLDDEPSGWRQCACAFLEAQHWQVQLSRVAAESHTPSPAPPVVRPQSFTSSRLGSWLVIAAGLLMAFMLGLEWPNTWGTLLARFQHDAPVVNAGVADSDSADDPWDSITLNWPGEGNRVESFKLPVLDGSTLSADWQPASALSPAFLQELQDQGLEVTSKQHIYPVELADGQRVLVPVEELEIRNSNEIY